MNAQTSLKLKLSAFMFLQYFIWGSWYVSMGTYLAHVLGFSGGQIGAAYSAFAIGAMISPFFVGLIADRYFASQRLIGFLGIVGGLVLVALGRIESFGAFYAVLILYCALYVPTLALGNSLSLHQLQNAKRDFPHVKIFAAVGWIAGGVTLSLIRGEHSPVQFYLAGGASLAFGLFALALPHTPPRKTGRVALGEVIGLDSLALLKKPSYAIFILSMFLICLPLNFYFVMMSIYLTELQWTGLAAKMTLAQVSDVVFLCLLPFMLKHWGYKKTFALGILAWAVRYFLLAHSVSAEVLQAAFIFAAILLHGVCYDFLFIAGQLYADGEANERMRGAVQGFLAFVLWGAGAFVGTLLAGRVLAAHRLAAPQGVIDHDWYGIWIIPAIGACAVMAVFLIFFREPARAPTKTLVESAPATSNPALDSADV